MIVCLLNIAFRLPRPTLLTRDFQVPPFPDGQLSAGLYRQILDGFVTLRISCGVKILQAHKSADSLPGNGKNPQLRPAIAKFA